MSIVAVGSSYASGAGVPPYSDRQALRSAHNYPTAVAAALDEPLTDLTRSGATTAEIIAEQIPLVPAGASLVTVTAGGNDVRFIMTALLWSLAGRPGWRPVADMIRRRAGTPPSPGEAERVVAAGLTAVCAAIADRAPSARIVLADYATVFGDHAADGHAHLSGPQIEALRRIEHAIARAHRTAADDAKATLVRVSDATRDHGIGSDDPWITGPPQWIWQLPSRPPFHPSAAGVRAYTDAITSVLR